MTATIAVIEDDRDILHLVREVLEIDGFEVATFSSPDVARIAAMNTHPHLFLIDLMLPEMSGVELASRLQQHGYTSTPMIAMSASRLMLEVASGSGLFQDVLAKPFNLSALLSTIESALGTAYTPQPAAS